MKLKVIIVLIIFGAVAFGYYLFSQNKISNTKNPTPSPATGQTGQKTTSPTPNASPTPDQDTQSAIAAFLAEKYDKPVSDVHVTVQKEVPGYASGSVLFGQGGPGEGGMWLAMMKDNAWVVVWDGNGNVDCDKMRQEYHFPDTILKPNFCD